jgi:FtsP/CotA-like multicopper oxidase with cupredoxin domain
MHSHFLLPVDYYLAAWFALTAASTLYVAIDGAKNPEPSVMKWGFVLVTLYTGPFGLLLYVVADKEPRPGAHEQFVRPLWKQGVGSTIHCVAGDATGIILAAVIVALLGLPMWLDLIVEYLAGFAFGLFIFQSLFMKQMMGGSYFENVRRSFFPEFISMNFMMAGMAPVMSFLMMGHDMRAMVPTELIFWGVMSLGVMAGFATAYPSNVWMVAQGLKHGLMTERAAAPPTLEPESAESNARAAHHEYRAHGEHAAASEESAPAHDIDAHAVGHDSMHMHGASEATSAQIAAFSLASLVLLATGMLAPANWVNMRLSAHDVGGLIMPPGMQMYRTTTAAAMREMSFADSRLVGAQFPIQARGDRELPFKLDGGVKVFELTASVIRWRILTGVAVDAYAYNDQIPGPRIHIREGDRVRIRVRNDLPEATTVHWHGLILENAMDGPSEITQPPIPPGGFFDYEFTARQHGTYFYHPHAEPDRTQALGLYGALIIDPLDEAAEISADHDYVIQLQEWLWRDGLTFPAMPMDGMQPNYFTINGKAYPSTDTIRMKLGETLKVRFIGTNNGFIHPMHIHGGPFEVVARDGETIAKSARYLADTVNVGPGQRYDVIWTARERGKWLIHCHIPHHTSNDNTEAKGGGGLMAVIEVE